MNVYDFDGTIYNGDSTADFYFYCLKKFPRIASQWPNTANKFALYRMGVISKTDFKESMYRFLKYVDDIDSVLKSFWKSHKKNIKSWYLKQKQPSDIIISASPEFLLKPICSKLNVYIIASRVDRFTGEYNGENCWGKEKVRRLDEKFRGFKIDEFYSDSYSDLPLAVLADRAFIVKGNKITLWRKEKNYEQ